MNTTGEYTHGEYEALKAQEEIMSPEEAAVRLPALFGQKPVVWRDMRTTSLEASAYPYLVIMDHDAWEAGAPDLWGTPLPLGYTSETISELEAAYEAEGGSVSGQWVLDGEGEGR